MIAHKELTESVLATMSPSPRRPQLDTFLHFIYLMSLSYVQRQENIVQQCKRLGTNPAELACDTVEDLVRTNANGAMFKLNQFFDTMKPPSDFEKTELFTALRILTLGATQRTLSKSCVQLDPSLFALAKLLKEIATKENPDLVFVFDDQVFLGQTILQYSQAASQPLFPTEFLFAELKPSVSKETTPQEVLPLLLSSISDREYLHAISLVQATVLVKMLIPSFQDYDGNILTKETIDTISAMAIEQVYTPRTLYYARSGGFTAEEVESHINAAQELARDDLTRRKGHSREPYEILSRYLPELDEQTYAEKHRAQFEPLARDAKTKARQILLKAL